MLLQESVRNALKAFGLTDAEIAIYCTLIEIGSQPASLIAKKAGLKRGHTYNILALLIQKGLVQEVIQNKIRYFSGRPPKTLLSMVDHREEQLKTLTRTLNAVIPDLEKISNPLLAKAKVRFFRGIEGIKEIYEDTIRVRKQNIYGIGDFDYYFPQRQNRELNTWIWQYASRRSSRGIWYIGIINKSKMSDIADRRCLWQKRKLKMLKNIYLPVEINIYGDKVAVMSTYKDMVGLIIEDAPIAETLRNFHQAIWKFLPDYV